MTDNQHDIPLLRNISRVRSCVTKRSRTVHLGDVSKTCATRWSMQLSDPCRIKRGDSWMMQASTQNSSSLQATELRSAAMHAFHKSFAVNSSYDADADSLWGRIEPQALVHLCVRSGDMRIRKFTWNNSRECCTSCMKSFLCFVHPPAITPRCFRRFCECP